MPLQDGRVRIFRGPDALSNVDSLSVSLSPESTLQQMTAQDPQVGRTSPRFRETRALCIHIPSKVFFLQQLAKLHPKHALTLYFLKPKVGRPAALSEAPRVIGLKAAETRNYSLRCRKRILKSSRTLRGVVGLDWEFGGGSGSGEWGLQEYIKLVPCLL